MYKVIISLLVGCCFLFGCSSHPLSKGRSFRLEEVSYSDLSGWQQDDFKESYPALKYACENPADNWRDFCSRLDAYEIATSDELREYIENNLTPYRVISYGSSTGRITGYYESELTGTRFRVRENQVPIYGLPYDYNKDKKHDTRSDIEGNDDFNAPILAWADCPTDVFLLHVQGSGRMQTPEGEIKLGYAGSNNRKFSGIGQILTEEGLIEETGHSMVQIRQWLKENPEQARELMAKNDRYIFFREITGDTPIGYAGVPLTPLHSVAVDKNYIPMQTPMWLVTQTPDKQDVQTLVVAQDIGSAIKGGIRADYFFGHGEEAFNLAGRMNTNGSYYLLLPK